MTKMVESGKGEKESIMGGGSRSSHTEAYRGFDFSPERSTTSREDVLKAERKKAAEDERRRLELERKRAAIAAGEARKKVVTVAEASRLVDRGLARNKIGPLDGQADMAVVWVIDFSFSNQAIANKFLSGAPGMLAALEALRSGLRLCTILFSDWSDGVDILQFTDWVPPSEQGQQVFQASLANVSVANGGDAPEAVDFALMTACRLDFGDLPREQRQLVLVTDSIPHHTLGWTRWDNGDPVSNPDLFRDHRAAIERVHGPIDGKIGMQVALPAVEETFGSFSVIGCSGLPQMAKLQESMIPLPARLPFDFIALDHMRDEQDRKHLVGTLLQFLVARNLGFRPTIRWMQAKYGDWLANPARGQQSDQTAREIFTRLAGFVEGIDEKERAEMLRLVFGD